MTFEEPDNQALLPGRYQVRAFDGQWEVYDAENGATATLNEKALRHSLLRNAQTIAILLNEIDNETFGKVAN